MVPHPGIRNHYGFIAQEVKAVLNELNVDNFAGWILSDPADPESNQGLRYSEFISPLTKAVQELNTRINTLEAENAQLRSDIAAMKAFINMP